MDSSQICRQFLIYILLLFAFFNMAQGRAMSNNLIEASNIGNLQYDTNKGVKADDDGHKNKNYKMIGSRPPKCERIRCRNCGHCEAVQVPITIPQSQINNNIAYSIRSHHLSNYKPISWKCKCGDYLFNP